MNAYLLVFFLPIFYFPISHVRKVMIFIFNLFLYQKVEKNVVVEILFEHAFSIRHLYNIFLFLLTEFLLYEMSEQTF